MQQEPYAPDDAAQETLDAARGAHRTSQKILDLMTEPGAAEDPIAIILAMLASIQATQQTLLTRLDILERRLASRG